MEYLSTYGWAIIVVLLVGIVLHNSGLFNAQMSGTTFSGFNRIKPFLTGTSMDSDGNFVTVFTNTFNTQIATGTTGLRVFVDGGTSCTSASISPTLIQKGDEFLLQAEGCESGNTGDYYKINLQIPINITIGKTQTQRFENGSIRGLVGG